MKIHHGVLLAFLVTTVFFLPSFGKENPCFCKGTLLDASGMASPDVAFKIVDKKGNPHCYLRKGAGLEKWLGKWVRVEGKCCGTFEKLLIIDPVSVFGREGARRTWTGTLKPIGVSIYMQGTHVLTDPKGKIKCLLKSGDPGIQLENYLGKHVRVSGHSERTVEGNQTLVTVEGIEVIK
ncbi:MAG: hypothetical protein HYU64_09345 [Armatimonadetes bacterium]|nr:hypothetical protein [Armatimonadota bacterium]